MLSNSNDPTQELFAEEGGGRIFEHGRIIGRLRYLLQFLTNSAVRNVIQRCFTPNLIIDKVVGYGSSKANRRLTTLYQAHCNHFTNCLHTMDGNDIFGPEDVKASFIRSWKNSCRGPPSSTDGSPTKTTFNIFLEKARMASEKRWLLRT